jgi:hypothetical protein
MARPTKLTPAVEEKIVRAIRAGNYPEVAARHAGIHPATYYRWMERGALEGEAPEDDPYRRFRAEVERALADAEIADVGLIERAARNGDWRAAAFLLERRHRERWRRGEGRELETAREGKPVVDRGSQWTSQEEFDRQVEELIAAARSAALEEEAEGGG